MSKRHVLTLMSIFLVLALALAACSSADPTATPAPAATEAPMAEPTEEMMEEPTEEPMAESNTIVDIAVADGRFKTLVAAVEAAGLVDTLKSDGPFTVFAPTDDAFAALGDEAIAGLLADPETLSQILLYHVVPGRVMAADVGALESATTAQGEDIAITVDGDKVMVNGANVIITDIEADNGVIHVIDAVILPPSMSAEAAPTIVDIAVADGNFTNLVAALEATGLVETLQGEGPFTVFAPTDEAFAALGEETIAALLADPDTLSQILLYHVVAGAVTAADVVNLDSATTVQGEDVTISVDNGSIMINDAMVILPDIEAANGIIHVIDTVILPPSIAAASLPDIVDTAAEAGQFTTLLVAAEAAGLVDTLKGEGPFTVFAPTDDAFAALGDETIAALLADPETLANILLYHVVPGEVLAADVAELASAETAAGFPVVIKATDDGVMVNNANVVASDIMASNGVIHVIDAVILPPTTDIVDTAIADGRFTTLVAAVEAAGLVDALKGEGPLTVFAPTDDAFAVLGTDTINSLLADPETLASILLYHVVDGAVFSGDVVKLESATTLNGADITIRVDEDGNVFINDAQVIIADIITTNGVIHVIDAVILPPA
ncbi:MAG: fasciclin domain-containing protein [Ardenticatenaceae bacterium]|nr:fasciclin domain-containing protein [Ardenticatenaceae bacterium]